MNGFLNLIKPTGMTSHDVVSSVRRLLKIKKVGHTGTLDPNAAGVLPVCVGRAAKFSDYLLKEEKQYFAKVGFGALTDTLDTYGSVVSTKDIRPFSLEQLEKVLQEFTGDIEQFPPKYSAIKIGGRKLYEMARNNEELPDIKPRAVCISSIDICSFSSESVDLDIVCSAGTYIRSLARDIGEKLDNEAYLSLLIRKRSGNFSIDEGITLEELEEFVREGRLDEVLIPIDGALSSYPELYLSTIEDKHYKNGCTLVLTQRKCREGIYRVYDEEGGFSGLGNLELQKDKLYLRSLKLARVTE